MSVDVPENVPQGAEVLSRNSVFRSSFLVLQKHYILLMFINGIMIQGNTCRYSFMVDKCISGREQLDGQCPDVTFKCLNRFSSQDHVCKNILTKAQCLFRNRSKLSCVLHSWLQVMKLFAMLCDHSPISFSFILGEQKDQVK